jgi:hypothetical protein
MCPNRRGRTKIAIQAEIFEAPGLGAAHDVGRGWVDKFPQPPPVPPKPACGSHIQYTVQWGKLKSLLIISPTKLNRGANMTREQATKQISNPSKNIFWF